VKSRAGLNDGRAQLLETSIPGIFTAGDMHEKSTKQVVSAADEGGSAALIIWEYLKRM
jgi:thioredoxin reductase (NADPH)